jgi:hypothetical protein
MMILTDRSMKWDENKITRMLNILISVYNQLCWRPQNIPLLQDTQQDAENEDSNTLLDRTSLDLRPFGL